MNYYDRQGNPVDEAGFVALFAGDRKVAQTQVGEFSVSTVHLVIDHGHGYGGPPIIFETMVFKGESATDHFMDRYATEEEARAGHANIVGMVRVLNEMGAGETDDGEAASYVVTAGALIRSRVRAFLDALGVEWTEHKGFLESSFSVRGTRAQVAKVNRMIEEVGA